MCIVDIIYSSITSLGNIMVPAGANANNDNDSNMNINISLQAKPEWRRHFPLNALLRPSINSFAHDQFHMPQQKKKQRRSTLSVTELRNATVVTHHPRIVNEATGERAMCAVESEVTRARNLEVALPLLLHPLQE